MLNDITVLVPEVTLVFGAILMLLYGAFLKAPLKILNSTGSFSISYENEAKNLLLIKHVGYLTFAMLCIAAFFLSLIANLEITVFGNTIEINYFVVFAKYVVLFAVSLNVLIAIGSCDLKSVPFEVFVLMILSTVGMMLMISANDLLTLYLGLELMSLSLYVLVAYLRENLKVSEAALKYFILGALASGIYLFGSSMVYGLAGSTNFDIIREYYLSTTVQNVSLNLNDASTMSVPLGFIVGVVFILIAFFFKMSAAPFHMWTPDVYEGAPTIITSFLASAAKVSVALFFTKLLYQVLFDLGDEWQQVLIAAAIASIAIGALGALMQNNIKRLIAYSGIGHVGFILLALAVNDFSGIHSAITYIVIYLIMTITIFALLFTFRDKDGQLKTEINQLAGLSKTNPALAFAICIVMFSMAGIPPFAGFFAKFFVLLSVVKQELYAAAIFAVIFTVISSFYYLRIIKIVYFDENESENMLVKSIILGAVICVGTAFNMFYVVLLEYASSFIESAASTFW